MEELGQGGTSRLETTLSARTRRNARVSGTCSSPSTPTRARIRSRASSTEITKALYRGTTRQQAWQTTGVAGNWRRYRRRRRRDLVGLAEDGLVLRDEPAAAEREEGEEAGSDQDLLDPQWKVDVLVERREHHQHVLDEDRDPAEEEDDREDLVARGGPAREPLEQVRERDQPSDDEDEPGDHAPRRVEEARGEEARLDRHVAIPDHEVLREEEVHPHDGHGEGQLGHVLDARGRDIGDAARVRPYGQEGHEPEAGVQRLDHVVAAEQPAVPDRVERHHEVEGPEGDHDHE